MNTVEVVEPHDQTAIEAVRELWRMYWHSLGLPPDFQNFAAELETLPGEYAQPAGCLLLVRVDREAAGTAALRPLAMGAGEAKRLFVHPAYRRRGVASALLARLVEEARSRGYRSLYGDTLGTMRPALDLYRTAGFAEVGPYSDSPTPDAVYLRLDL